MLWLRIPSDVMITTPTAKSYAIAAALNQLSAAKAGECRKSKKYEELAAKACIKFIPCVAKSFRSYDTQDLAVKSLTFVLAQFF